MMTMKISDIKKLVSAYHTVASRQERDSVKKRKLSDSKEEYRLVEWVFNPALYTPIATGGATKRTFTSKDHIWSEFQRGALFCAGDFHEFRNNDVHVERFVKENPKYVAVFRLVDGRYIIPQSKHYRQAYRNDKRTDQTLAGSFTENGAPYWCCLYWLRVLNERLSKQRYQRRKHERGAFGTGRISIWPDSIPN
jgi:hypothetical protein